MVAETQTKRGKKFVAYRCRNRAHGATPCPRPMTVSGRLLEPYIERLALEHLGSAALPPIDIDLAPYEEALEDARFDLKEFERSALDEGLAPAAVAGMLAQYQARVDAAQDALDGARLAAGDPRGPLTPEQMLAQWEASAIPQRRETLYEIFESITVERGTAPIGQRTVLASRLPLVGPLPADHVETR
jgi:hypothetical protein